VIGGNSNDHAVYELLVSTLFRKHDDFTKYYRNTDMKNPPLIIPLRSVHLIGKSATSKMIGAYMRKGMSAAMATEHTKNSKIEDLFRE
jgi:hypothetical protein